MKESTLRGIVVAALKRHSAFAVENLCHDGTPDVCSTLGFIELKCVDRWPIRSTSKVGIDLRKSQKLWLQRWTRCDGSALVLTVVRGEWFVHDGEWAAKNLVDATEQQMRDGALKIWPGRPKDSILRAELERLHARPTPMLLWCPMCSDRHVDAGRFATKSHHTHACQSCGNVWRPAIQPTVGVQFLPGFKDG